MPTLFAVPPFRCVINTNDHGELGDIENPAHVHFYLRQGTAVDVMVSIGDVDVRPRILRRIGVRADVAEWFKELVEQRQGWLITRWREIHER